ncbi:MAG: Gfo/Idh/MocA family oxidoreductase [Balneolaceae bacterium]
MEENNRRSFLKKSALAVAGAGLFSTLPFRIHGLNAPSDRINIGVIGVNFGAVNMRRMLDGDSGVHCIALCDVDQVRLEEKASELKNEHPDQTGNLKLYSDFRELLDNKDIDGVIIATPDHWHMYMYAEACKAGKAIYIEKPTGHTVSDCRLMVDLQQAHQNVVTTGLWHISLEYFIDAFNILKSGVLGDVYKVHAWITGSTDPAIYSNELQEVPDTLDYERWLGPAPSRSYASERLHGQWRRYWNFGGGGQTDWVHYLDSALDGISALGHERTYPKSIYSVGYKHPKTMHETPSLQTSIFQFEDYKIVWEQQVSNLYNRGDGVAWIGSNGTLVCNRVGYEIIPETSNGQPVIAESKMQGSYGNQYNHMINWAECIRNNNTNTNGNIAKGSYASELAAIANISHRVGGQSLEYLPDERKFRNNSEADSYISNEYHNGWNYPQV